MYRYKEMIGNYEERKVDRFESNELVISTAAVNDSDQPYETGIRHDSYNNGKFVIVEMYDDIESARKGHTKWVEKMTNPELPECLVDVSSSEESLSWDGEIGDEKRNHKRNDL